MCNLLAYLFISQKNLDLAQKFIKASLKIVSLVPKTSHRSFKLKTEYTIAIQMLQIVIGYSNQTMSLDKLDKLAESNIQLLDNLFSIEQIDSLALTDPNHKQGNKDLNELATEHKDAAKGGQDPDDEDDCVVSENDQSEIAQHCRYSELSQINLYGLCLFSQIVISLKKDKDVDKAIEQCQSVMSKIKMRQAYFNKEN